MLDQGNSAVLAAPVSDFYRELDRIHAIPSARSEAHPETDYPDQTLSADVADLRAALRHTDLTREKRDQLVSQYQVARIQLAQIRPAQTQVQDTGESTAEPQATVPAPALQGSVTVPAGLPGEFEDYFRGSLAWHLERTNEARQSWEALLKRPAGERQYHSTWAAYMLGKLSQDVDPAKAIKRFQQVRALAAAGFADRLGLAAASLGWEAREELRRGNYDRAIPLYLQQLSTGDRSAYVSLRITALHALNQPSDRLSLLATNRECRRVITAYLTSCPNGEVLFENDDSSNSENPPTIVSRWLGAVEAAQVTDLESAEQLALAAYQAGNWRMAQRWIERAPKTPVADWLQAKLLLRSGKFADACALLERVATFFPEADLDTNQPVATELKDNLFLPGFTYRNPEVKPADQVRAEIGMLRLARRDYVESLDAFLRSGFWMDAAYVAERVLTLDELKAYVDREWPAAAPVQPGTTNLNEEGVLPVGFDPREEIRYLLARRLTRQERGNEALEYYPVQVREDFNELVRSLTIEGSGASSPAQRAEALFAAAKITRARGMELIGTEVEPDWHIHNGRFESGVTIDSRGTNAESRPFDATPQELERARMHGVAPEERFHYRDQAAALAWEAAQLMPNDSEATARVLCEAGSWLKNIDPELADGFYKSLVRRCRNTEIGKVADRRRWFPNLDADGNLIPWKPVPPSEIETDASDDPAETNLKPGGYWFVLNRGNTLEDVAAAVLAAHQYTVLPAQILAANPAINPSRLKPGQKIFVPTVTAEEAPPASPPDDAGNQL